MSSSQRKSFLLLFVFVLLASLAPTLADQTEWKCRQINSRQVCHATHEYGRWTGTNTTGTTDMSTTSSTTYTQEQNAAPSRPVQHHPRVNIDAIIIFASVGWLLYIPFLAWLFIFVPWWIRNEAHRRRLKTGPGKYHWWALKRKMYQKGENGTIYAAEWRIIENRWQWRQVVPYEGPPGQPEQTQSNGFFTRWFKSKAAPPSQHSASLHTLAQLPTTNHGKVEKQSCWNWITRIRGNKDSSMSDTSTVVGLEPSQIDVAAWVTQVPNKSHHHGS